jgi:YD repeat-containing protein
MTITIGNSEFDHATYDAEADVLYLRAGDSKLAARTHATPQGHAIRYDERGRVIGMTIVNAKWILERDGHISITEEIPAEAFAEVLAAS